MKNIVYKLNYDQAKAQDGTCDPNDSLHILTDGTTNMDKGTALRFCGSAQTIPGMITPYNSVTVGN